MVKAPMQTNQGIDMVMAQTRQDIGRDIVKALIQTNQGIDMVNSCYPKQLRDRYGESSYPELLSKRHDK
jgi:hypothetical protein